MKMFRGKRLPLLLAFLAMPASIFAASDSNHTGLTSLAAANNEFGFKLLRELVTALPGKNICISPFSLASVLQILRNEAAGETRSELDKALETHGLSATDLARSYAELTRSLK